MIIFSTIIIVGIVLFAIIYLVAWFSYRNRPINLGERKKIKWM
jgi:uncharacterized membrane protein YqiK